MNKTIQKKEKAAPICIGTGLVALDIILNGNPKTLPKIYAGGSCGNVMAILSFLNWKTYPIARLANNNAAKELVSDLTKFKVSPNFISCTSDGSTPIIIQRIKIDKLGNPIHRFEFRDPDTGAYLPSYKPVLGASVESIIKKSPSPNVYYFDRINRASIDLASEYKKLGSVVFFEPSSIGEPRLFEQCLNVADIIKFSADRIPNYSNMYPKQRVPLEIETNGKDGLRYRFSHSLSSKSWKHSPSYKIGGIVDAAGAGDWCSAGIIAIIGNTGNDGFKKIKAAEISKAVKYGQALGAINCCFNGARGTMYNLNPKDIHQIIAKLSSNKELSLAVFNKKTKDKRTTIFKLAELL